mgnify:CR=1 FL=1
MRINELLPVVDKYSTMFEKHWNYASESVKTPSIDKETAFNLTDQFVYKKYIFEVQICSVLEDVLLNH